MKIEIYGENSVPKETVLRLRLKTVNGIVTLCAVDGDGNRLSDGSLLRFNSDGSFYRVAGVTNSIPISRDAVANRMIESSSYGF